MDVKKELERIWANSLEDELPQYIKERGFVYAKNVNQKDILITGINPSFRHGDEMSSYSFDFQETLKDTKYDNYWGPIKKMLLDEELDIDLRTKSAYLDILYFREREQALLKKTILKTKRGVRFIADQINLTQHVVEDILKPKLIIIKNKESQIYWGRYSKDGIYWMGYDFEFIEHKYCGDLYRITGLHRTDQRVSNEIEKTNLEGTIVLFSYHINHIYFKRKKVKEFHH